jgi:L-ascorbate metabolism protein UlaG (beta-lactamase superfamily)
MKITKLWHCCLLIETKGKRLLTDPGCFTIEAHSNLENINAILFTHEHADHFHLESLKTLLEKNPDAVVFANTSVAELLTKESISHTIIHDGETVNFEGIILTGYGMYHAEIHSSLPFSSNTGYMVEDRFFYPWDAYTDPGCPVEILALPVSGPWVKIWEAIDYALRLKPKIAFPIHDHFRFWGSHIAPSKILPEHGIEFVPMLEGESREF